MAERYLDRGNLLAWLMDRARREDDAADVLGKDDLEHLAQEHRVRSASIWEIVAGIQMGHADAYMAPEHKPPPRSGEHPVDFGNVMDEPEPAVQDPTRRR
jgi:hypothetical protein